MLQKCDTLFIRVSSQDSHLFGDSIRKHVCFYSDIACVSSTNLFSVVILLIPLRVFCLTLKTCSVFQ